MPVETTPRTQLRTTEEAGQGGLPRWVLPLAGLAILALAAFTLSLFVGSVDIPPQQVLTVLLGEEPARAAWSTIVLDFRLPKAIAALLAGGALAVSGLSMQTLFRNPLADPYVFGLSAGASLGAALVLLAAGGVGVAMMAGLGLAGDAAVTLAAAAGAALVMALVLLASRWVRGTVTLLIIGIMIGYVAGALVSVLAHAAVPERLQAFINWTAGSFSSVTWSQMPIYAGVLAVGFGLSALMAKPLNALLLGDTYAASMGVPLGRARVSIIAATALLAGGVTAFCGPIGFLGLAAPHLARALLKSSDQRLLLPATALLGGTLALCADVVAQAPGATAVLPLNAVLALIGAPVAIGVIVRRGALREQGL
jgi:iron complex transport system permease protein